jgi:translation initiation factor IF-2
VLESAIDKGLGKIVTVIVKNGTVRKSDFIIAGSSFGKAKILIDENGKQVEKALPSTPVKVVGFEKLPSIGTTFLVSTKQEEIKALAVAAELQERNERLGEKFLIQEQDETEKKVNIILRTDVNGSLDAIKHLLSQLKVEGANLHIIRSSVGPIAETDIELAKSANAIVIGFNIKPSKATKELATSLKVTVLFYDVIYKLRDDIEQFLLGKLDPVVEEKETGEAKILQL